jgi:hypothetical protein
MQIDCVKTNRYLRSGTTPADGRCYSTPASLPAVSRERRDTLKSRRLSCPGALLPRKASFPCPWPAFVRNRAKCPALRS